MAEAASQLRKTKSAEVFPASSPSQPTIVVHLVKYKDCIQLYITKEPIRVVHQSIRQNGREAAKLIYCYLKKKSKHLLK